MLAYRSSFLAFSLGALLAGCSSSASSASGGDSGEGSPEGGAGRDSGRDGTTKADAKLSADGAKSGEAGGCGATSGSLCGLGSACGAGTDCTSGVCTGGVCVAPAPTCTDGKKDGQETDTDCGGPMCPACGTGKDCGVASDCVTALCLNGVCTAPTPTDTLKDDSETDTDCGGALLADGTANPASDGAPTCGVGKTCIIGLDCATGVCAAGPVLLDNLDGGMMSSGSSDASTADGAPAPLTCQPASDHDGVKNDSETDVDCGGALLVGGTTNPASDGAPTCVVGNTCAIDADCASGVCAAGAVLVDNLDGGTMSSGNGDASADGGLPTKTCQAPTPNDGVKNGGETGVDCGGSTAPGSDGAPPCGTGQGCASAGDCINGVCTAHVCVAPKPNDGVRNDSETDTDCGGALLAGGATNPDSDGATACADDKKCLLDSDCKSAVCSLVSHTCVDAVSCKGTITPAQIMDVTTPAGTTPNSADAVGTPDPNGVGQSAGLDTCGQGEATDPVGSQTHESCCKSIPVTIGGTALRYDKYEATAGRFRQFLESVSYDVRTWAKAQFNAAGVAQTAAGKALLADLPINQTGVTASGDVLQFLPSGNDPSVPLNAVIQTGALVMDTGGEQGCYTGIGEYGAATYWWDSSLLYQQGSSPPRPYTQDYYDIKSMNCIPYWLGAAFCAWDGGQLPTEAQHKFIWNNGSSTATQTYPWASTQLPNPYPGNSELQEAMYQPAVAHTVDWHNSNLGSSTGQGNFYFYPSSPLNEPLVAPASLDNGLDLTPYTAAPGRFFLDRTSYRVNGEGWQDLGGNMIEMGALSAYTGGQSFCDASGQLGAGESYNCNCPSNNCSNTSCGGSSAKCGITRAPAVLPANDILGGSWEGHAMTETLTTYPISRQYGKLGVRCVRPAE